MAADLSVRYRSETGDEAEMSRIITAVAPSARRLPSDAIPTMELEAYRTDRP